MSALEVVSLDTFDGFRFAEPDEQKAICEAMLIASSLKLVVVPPDLDDRYLRILEQRKDWKIEVKEEE